MQLMNFFKLPYFFDSILFKFRFILFEVYIFFHHILLFCFYIKYLLDRVHFFTAPHPGKLQEKVLDLSHYKKRGSFYFYEMMYKGRRVVVVYSQKLKARDEKKRQRLLDKLRDLVPDGEMSASRLVRGGGVRKFMETVKARVRVDQRKVERDARWDGLYAVCTNIEGAKPQELTLEKDFLQGLID